MNIKLSSLDPVFVRHERRIGTWRRCLENHLHTMTCGEEITGPQDYIIPVESLAEAQGVEFLDPVEFVRNNGDVGTSTVICWFRGKVPDDLDPGPGRWDVSGSDFTNLTLNPSVDLSLGGKHPDRWHGWVKNGEVT